MYGALTPTPAIYGRGAPVRIEDTFLESEHRAWERISLQPSFRTS
jgi:hypothetical protein